MKKEKRVKLQKKSKKDALQSKVVERFFPTIEEGLSSAQVASRIEDKLVNNTKIKTSKSYLSIFVKNICTFFNFLWLALAIALFCVGSYSNLIFLVVIVSNTALAIIQEIRAKITVEKLSLVTAPRVKVIRDGKKIEVLSQELVLDDIIVLANGDQIPADCIILDGQVEVNESLLTGESNAIEKGMEAHLLSGSFLVAGLCYARVEKVGKDCYINQIAARAREFKAPKSNLFRDLNRFIKYIGIALIPIGLLTILKEYMLGSGLKTIIEKTSGSLISMIPAGMFLLVTVSLAVGVMKLARKKTLVKDLYSIEMLSRSNVLCLDKTGTITDGTMKVVGFETYGRRKKENVEKIISCILHNQKSTNATSIALIEHFGKNSEMEATDKLEFSSQRKYSITAFGGKVYFLGAVSRIGCALTEEQEKLIDKCSKEGHRVVGISEYKGNFAKNMTGGKSTLISLIVLEEHIRDKAKETIEWFKANGVEVKIISGDDPKTVSKIAARVGVENYDKYVSLENFSLEEVADMADKFTVFGRVTPEQKYTLVKALKNQGKVVAMTGDGVNDTLALKEADCSIAMADGSEVARSISKLVLMDSNFTALPAVVKEGRQVVNNVQNASCLFVMKTLFAMLLSLITICCWIEYPFEPKNMFLLESLVIGVPSFLLTFEPNTKLIQGNFIPQVLKKSVPRALLMFAAVMACVILNEKTDILYTEFVSLAVLTLTLTGFLNLVSLCIPPSLIRWLTMGGSLICIVGAALLMGDFFGIYEFTRAVYLPLSIILACGVVIVGVCVACRKPFAKLGNKIVASLRKNK